MKTLSVLNVYSVYIKQRFKESNYRSLLILLIIFHCFSLSNAQVTYPQLQGVVKPNPDPGAPGDSFTPPMSGNPVVNTPACAEWTRTAGADETAVITGINFSNFTGVNHGKDTRFSVYEKNGMAKDAKIQRLDGDKVAVTLDPNLSSWGMYLIWPGNDAGYGRPIQINKTDTWWIGPNKTTKGSKVSVYGRNLAHNNDTLVSYVFIKPVSGAGQWATVTNVNPYKVEFIVPSNLANGNYEVWVHNGHGGEYGWGDPLTLTIQSPIAWTSTVINVANYGATGNGTTDDTQSILNAIKAAPNYATVYFPAGTYMISNTIEFKSNVKYKGAGKNNTILKCRSNFSAQYGAFSTSYQAVNVELSDISFDANGFYNGLTPPFLMRGATDLKIRDVNVYGKGYSTADFHLTNRVFLDNCMIVGGNQSGISVFLGNASQMFIDSCSFKLTNDVQACIAMWGGNGVSMTYSTCEDFDNSDPNSSDGWGLGRFFTGNGVWGSNRSTYLGNNITTDLTVRPPSPDQNVGEQFMWEGNATHWSGYPASAAATTLNISNYTSYGDNQYVSIIKGKGLGQTRRIVSYNNGQITLDKSWNVVPDNSSLLSIGSYADGIVVYNNYLDGKSYAPLKTEHVACAGIEPYGGITNFIASRNTLHELREGISNWTLRVPNDDVGIEPNYFSLFTNNKFIKCRWAMTNLVGNWAPQPSNVEGSGLLGSIFRKNIIQDPVMSGIRNSYEVLPNYPAIDITIYEHNTFSNLSTGVLSQKDGIENQIFYKNNFTRGSASSSGHGIQISSKIALRENNYSGYTNDYNSSSGIVAEAPYHVLEIFSNTGTNIIDTVFTLFNSGTIAMSWTITSSAPWLTFSPGTGNTANEKSSSSIALKANLTGLAAGIHKSYVTINSGSVTKTYTVILNLNGAVPSPNQAPVANAGTDKIITLPSNSVSLTGSGTDADGNITSYLWTKIAGPAQFSIVSPSQAQTSINNLAQGVYHFVLTVTDNNGATAKDTIVVTVNSAANQAPIANAGSDKTITLPTNSVSLTSSGTDADGTITNYLWTKIAGPSQFSIVSPSQAQTSINNLVQGVYQFVLTVTDNNGATAKDTLVVTVNAAANQAPVANAGSDKIITLPTNSVSLTGSGTDADGTITNYLWTKIAGPSQFSIVSPSQAQTSINNLAQGVYQFVLTVTDNNGATAKDTVVVTVNAAANQAPVANAGPDKSITLPVNTIKLNGSGTDPDGTITSYLWTKITGPSQFTIVLPTKSQTSINNLAQGVYQFVLTVTDNKGAKAKDTVVITVNGAVPAPNQAPVANAGPDKSITLPVNAVILNGSGTDSDGTIATYLWTKIAGPAQFAIVSPTLSQTTINNLAQGVYQFVLSVTDNNGATAKDTVVITVNPPINQPPVANAGPDKSITLPINSIILFGSGTNPYETIISYLWTKISGPNQFAILLPNQAQTEFTNLVEGVYQFLLTVTDNSGGTAKDTVVVTVNAAIPAPNQAPVANAGTDKIITLPSNSVSLTSSGTDADGTITNYLWTKIAGPSQFFIVSPSQAQTSINNLVQGVYQFVLTVTDNNGATAEDTVAVTVNAAANQSPVANAGTDKIITLPTNSVSLTGSGTDTDGSITNYLWTKIAGPSQFSIVSPSQAQTSINNLAQGVYQFVLTVTDNNGATAKDTLVVTVNAAANQTPVANAGSDKTITLPTNSVSLTGSGIDADGTITNYLWTKIAGPSQFSIVSPSQAQTSINNLAQGVYQFVLTVTDNNGATTKDSVVVTVNAAVPPPNQAPVANAGSNKTITLPTNSVSLTGSGSDADGTITSYFWDKISGPAQFNITNPNQAQTVINNLAQGVYQLVLTVTDNKGAVGKDTMFITVNPPINQPPVANAGPDKSITLPVNSITLFGSGTNPYETIISYSWTKISGPAQYTIVSPNQAQTEFTNLVEGVYLFLLTVTDNTGAIGKDTVFVTVNPAESLKVSAMLYPNPANDYININIQSTRSSSMTAIRIYDIKGVILYYEQFFRNQPSLTKQVNISSFLKGTYIVEVSEGNKNKQTSKFVKV